jgi:alpha-tubulin suppressor-like RCC1 family protein
MTVFLTSDGALFASGSYGTSDPVYSPNAIPIRVPTNGTGIDNSTIVMISSRSTHALVLTSDGHVYAFGQNGDGQLLSDLLYIF